MSNEIHQALFSALGVDPVPMGLADALVANQQGTIDGMDNPMSGLYTTSVYEFDKYIAVTNHVYTAQAVIMSNKAWSSMTPDDQAIFMEAVKEATEFDREQQAIQVLVIAVYPFISFCFSSRSSHIHLFLSYLIFILILSSKMLNGLHRAEDRQI